MAPGRFITLEGGEGAGKSTQAVALAAHLARRGMTVVTTREPGGTPNAEAVRQLLVTGAADRWDALGELMLLNAARRDHVQRVIAPALQRGDWVVCDRYVDSTRVYQGAVKGVDDGLIRELHGLSTGGLWPDLTVLLDIDPAVGLARAQARRGAEARFEGEGLAFHQRLRTAFQAMAQAEPGRWLTVPAEGPPEAVTAALFQAIDRALPCAT